jgi:hypothetical protein
MNFNAMQVTNEMQGLDVQATLAWSIFRDGDGPFLAYKNLGADLEKETPHKTNAKLMAMA